MSDNKELTGYLANLNNERVFVIADNISDAMDKLQKLAGDEPDSYSLKSHSSIRVIDGTVIKPTLITKLICSNPECQMEHMEYGCHGFCSAACMQEVEGKTH